MYLLKSRWLLDVLDACDCCDNRLCICAVGIVCLWERTCRFIGARAAVLIICLRHEL